MNWKNNNRKLNTLLITDIYLSASPRSSLAKLAEGFGLTKDDIELIVLQNHECKVTGHKNIQQDNYFNGELTCRKCKKVTKKNGYLYHCKDIVCGAVFWDPNVLNEDLDDAVILNQVLKNSNVPTDEELENDKYHRRNHAYVIFCKNSDAATTKINYCYYVGQTGNHPYQRYLEHLRKYKSDPRLGNMRLAERAWYMEYFEGPYRKNKALKLEKAFTINRSCAAYSN